MQKFTGFEYLMIDCANHKGLDKLPFEERIQWVKDNLDNLEAFNHEADTPNLYIASTMAIRKAQQGIPTGYLVGFDATCSGIQIMSTLTGCIDGARATGLVDPHRRADAYSEVTERLNKILHSQGVNINVKRSDAKQALMTAFYGSTLEPKLVFGEDSPELAAFYQAAEEMAPGATELLGDLLASWDPAAYKHEWQLPDGYDVSVKVMAPGETKFDVDELDGASFTYAYSNNEPVPQAPKNAANVVHSIDAYVVRSIQRRCNYDKDMVERAVSFISNRLTLQAIMGVTEWESTTSDNKEVNYYIDLYTKSGMPDVVILPYINESTVHNLSSKHLRELEAIGRQMLTHKPFPVLTVHDEFKCHANNMNHLRAHYIDIFAYMADSKILDMICSKLFKTDDVYTKKSTDLSKHIRNSNYALC